MGDGVDVVLNSLADKMLERSFEVISRNLKIPGNRQARHLGEGAGGEAGSAVFNISSSIGVRTCGMIPRSLEGCCGKLWLVYRGEI